MVLIEIDPFLWTSRHCAEEVFPGRRFEMLRSSPVLS